MTPGEYLRQLANLNLLTTGLRNVARKLHDVAQHLEDRPIETCFGNLPGIGNERLFAGCKSFDAEEFPTPESIQQHLDLWKSAYERTRVAWSKLRDDERRKYPPPPDWYKSLDEQLDR